MVQEAEYRRKVELKWVEQFRTNKSMGYPDAPSAKWKESRRCLARAGKGTASCHVQFSLGKVGPERILAPGAAKVWRQPFLDDSLAQEQHAVTIQEGRKAVVRCGCTEDGSADGADVLAFCMPSLGNQFSLPREGT